MSTFSRITQPTRIPHTTTAVRVAACVIAAASTVVLSPVNLSPVSAHEPLPPATSTPTTWYAVPLSSLDGRTLAQYVTDHQARVLGPLAG